MLWFGSQMEHSLINPNQIREYGVPVYDDPYSNSHFGIDGNETFIPFNTTGTIVYFESRVPTDWEMQNLPIIMLTGEEWDPVNVGLGSGRSIEANEMRTIRALESGIPKRKMAAMKQRELNSQVEQYGEVKCELAEGVWHHYNRQTFKGRTRGTIKEVEYWFTNGKGYARGYYAARS